METLDDLLQVIPGEKDREEVRRLARQYLDLERQEQRGDRDAIMDRIMDRIAWGFRALRLPRPTRQDVERLIDEAGSAGG